MLSTDPIRRIHITTDEPQHYTRLIELPLSVDEVALSDAKLKSLYLAATAQVKKPRKKVKYTSVGPILIASYIN